ncbi:histidine kinase [Kribbella antiqua]|uniref:histidine kinase n=1 Tax=Kribbella antiqua TaxID=2512217 RepID=A0A4R2IPS3_9ACTN|nr:histidine kinase dimerization/phosphoacceptor domain-containing protein [Kribbella antiqua]TCO47183.1 histidine kinase [Kribbella antiqua]
MTESALTQQLSRRQLIAFDCLVAVVYAVLLVLTTPVDAPPWTVLVTVGLAVPVAVRRLWPRPALVVVIGLSVVAVVLQVLRDPLLAASFVLYVVGLTRAAAPATNRLLSAAGAVGVVVLFLGVMGGSSRGSTNVALVLSGLAAMYGTWMLGRVIRDRRAAAVQAARALAERAVSDERLRIARELHDIVAHSMGLIAVKAGVANHVLKVRPEEVSDALSVIETTSRDALVELRHMLGLLRTPFSPAPLGGLAALPELVERVESTGGGGLVGRRRAGRFARGGGVDRVSDRPGVLDECGPARAGHSLPRRGCWRRVRRTGRSE